MATDFVHFLFIKIHKYRNMFSVFPPATLSQKISLAVRSWLENKLFHTSWVQFSLPFPYRESDVVGLTFNDDVEEKRAEDLSN